MGLVAQASRSSQSMMRKPDPLTVVKVFDTFRLIAKVHHLHPQIDLDLYGGMHFIPMNEILFLILTSMVETVV